VLRVLIGEQTYATEATTVSILEANIDDATPQVLGYAMERLLASGALDVTLTPIFMKKNRPATQLSVIATPETQEQLAAILFAETPTLGLRVYRAERRILARHVASVETPYGAVRVKYSDSGSFNPEYEDCHKAAQDHQVPLRAVIAEASAAYQAQTKKAGS
jgi:pyridinium-3,5-bisthiocarboxylic acid mononucleotide nickel chelatase